MTTLSRFLVTILLLLCLSSCVLTKRQRPGFSDLQTFSIVKIKVLIDGRSNKNVYCNVVFMDESSNVAKVIMRDNSSGFYILSSESGRLRLESMMCTDRNSIYPKYRFIEFNHLVSYVRPNLVNYIGDLSIDYSPKKFNALDLILLGWVESDKKGVIKVKISDNIYGAIDAVAEDYTDLIDHKFTKSILGDVAKIRPNDRPDLYEIKTESYQIDESK